MNGGLDDRRLRRAVRGALDDLVAAAPTAADPPGHRPAPERSGRGPWLHVAAGLTAAAGVIGVVAIANLDDDSAVGEPTDAPHTTVATVATSEPENAAPLVTTTTEGPTTSTTLPVPGLIAPAGQCGTATVPDQAATTQSIVGDIDGDQVDDTVTIYAVNDEWRVHATSSVTGKSSDTAIELTLGDSIEMAAVSLASIDSPLAIMVTAEGENDLGISANFTFLTLNRDYCIEQWIYRNAQDVDEPFEWITLHEPGHVTGMICDGTARPRRYRLVDSEQQPDGSWRVVNRVLTHNFTRAEIEFLPPDTIPDSPDFAAQYGAIVDCD